MKLHFFFRALQAYDYDDSGYEGCRIITFIPTVQLYPTHWKVAEREVSKENRFEFHDTGVYNHTLIWSFAFRFLLWEVAISFQAEYKTGKRNE